MKKLRNDQVTLTKMFKPGELEYNHQHANYNDKIINKLQIKVCLASILQDDRSQS